MLTLERAYEMSEAVDADRNFIADSWRRSLQDAPAYGRMPARGYVAWINTIITHFLGAGGALALADTDRLLVARDKVRPTYLYGWLLGRDLKPGFALVYLFVKGAHRREGIAKKLLAHAIEGASDGPLTYAFHTRFDPWLEGLGMSFSPVQRLEYAKGMAS